MIVGKHLYDQLKSEHRGVSVSCLSSLVAEWLQFYKAVSKGKLLEKKKICEHFEKVKNSRKSEKVKKKVRKSRKKSLPNSKKSPVHVFGSDSFLEQCENIRYFYSCNC